MSEEQTERVCDLAAEAGLNDDDMIRLYGRISNALSTEFGPGKVDSGMGGGWCDFWIRDGGMEYKLVMKPHRSLGKPS